MSSDVTSDVLVRNLKAALSKDQKREYNNHIRSGKEAEAISDDYAAFCAYEQAQLVHADPKVSYIQIMIIIIIIFSAASSRSPTRWTLPLTMVTVLLQLLRKIDRLRVRPTVAALLEAQVRHLVYSCFS